MDLMFILRTKDKCGHGTGGFYVCTPTAGANEMRPVSVHDVVAGLVTSPMSEIVTLLILDMEVRVLVRNPDKECQTRR